MRIYRFQEPYAVFETESFIGQCAYRTNVDDVTDKVVIERFLDVGCDLGMVAAIEYTMNAFIGELVGGEYTTVTQDATRHVQLYIRPQIMFRKLTAGEFVTGAFRAMFVAEILQVTFTG